MIVVAIAAGLIGYVIGKPNQAQEEASKPTEPTEPDVPHAVKWNGHWYALVDDKDYTITEAKASEVARKLQEQLKQALQTGQTGVIRLQVSEEDQKKIRANPHTYWWHQEYPQAT